MGSRPQVGRYVLLRLLGRGGTSNVHAAVREGDGNLVVLKQLHAELASHDLAKARLRREAELAALLQHPNIGRLIDAGWVDDQLYLVMEHIAGVNLAQLNRAFLDRGELVPYAVSLTLARRALLGLEYAHDLAGPDGTPLGVVHRDLSPSNIMLGEDGRARIIDFGAVRVTPFTEVTVPGTVLGTPRYMSPEQASGQGVDARSDLYTLAVVLYELLTAQRFVQKGERLEVLRKVVEARPPPAHVVNPKLPRALSDVLVRALDKAPAARFGSAAELRAALEAATGAWAFVPQDRMAGFFARNFAAVTQAAGALRAEARREGVQRRPADLTLELFESARAERHVPTRLDAVAPAPLDSGEMHAPTRSEPLPEEAEPTEETVPRFDDPLDADPVTVVTAAPAPVAAKPETLDPQPARPTKLLDPASRRPEPPRPRRGFGPIAAAVLLPALLGTGYVLGRAQREEPVRVPTAPPPAAPPAAPPRPAATPVAEPKPPEPAGSAAPVETPRAPSPPTKVPAAPDPEPQPEADPEPEADPLAPARAALDGAPLDRAAFLRVHAQLEGLAAALPYSDRQRVAVHLRAAERALDPIELRAALDAISQVRARR